MTSYDIENWFTYDEPTPEQAEKYQVLRYKAKDLADLIVALVPDCPDKFAALRLLRESLMVANAGIAWKSR